MPYPRIDSSAIPVRPLAQRQSFIDIRAAAADPASASLKGLDARLQAQLRDLAGRILAARDRGASVMLAYGAHLIKNGGGPLLRALIDGGWLTHLATQGAGIIHDFEFAFQGLSSESVRDNVAVGQFGHWDETGRFINLAALVGGADGLGLGESIGRMMHQQRLDLPTRRALAQAIAAAPTDPRTGARADLLDVMTRFDLEGGQISVPQPFGQFSVPNCAYAAGAAFTVHPGIGYDIFTNHPMFHGGAIGRGAGIDARVFARSVLDLSDGVYLSVGSAIMSPQVFEKALSVANSLRLAAGEPAVRGHTIAVVDIQEGGGWDWTAGEPPKDNPAYYLRFCKSFYRMGGRVDYLCSDNIAALAGLIAALNE